jgi:hypothetical protein
MTGEQLKAILIRGDFDDVQHVLEVAAQQAKSIFKTDEKITVKDVMRWSPYGWIVLVAKPQMVAEVKLLVGRGGVRR